MQRYKNSKSIVQFMKKLIILAGLPGVGKSYTARKLKNIYYFDSDKFSKNIAKIDITKLSEKDLKRHRLKFHKKKIESILIKFNKNNKIVLDTCFDLPESRNMYYALKPKIKVIIIELICPESIVKERIFENIHESDRMIGTKNDRWNFYQKMKKLWIPINNPDLIIDTSKKNYFEKIKL